jgi:tripartite-type tricarboxylate transporter receptor subunit TctC
VEAAGPQGFDIVAPNWLGLFAPAGANPEMIRQVSSALAQIQNDPGFVTAVGRTSAWPVSAYQATPDGLTDSIRLAISLQR